MTVHDPGNLSLIRAMASHMGDEARAVNNYMKGCLWEGIFTEYSAVQNTIVGNTVIANVTYDQGM